MRLPPPRSRAPFRLPQSCVTWMSGAPETPAWNRRPDSIANFPLRSRTRRGGPSRSERKYKEQRQRVGITCISSDSIFEM